MKITLEQPSDERAERFANAFAAVGELVGSLPVTVRTSTPVERTDGATVAKVIGTALAVGALAAAVVRRRRKGQKASATVQSAAPPQSAQAPVDNDATLTRKVETELFRDDAVPKGDIAVNAVNGVVTLRGQVDDGGLRSRLEDEARKIPGVRDVQNLLHGSSEPAQAAAPPPAEEVKERLGEDTPRSGLTDTPAAGGEDRSSGADDANVGTGEEQGGATS